MITHNVAMPRWRAMVLCLAGVLAMTKPLATGISLYRETLPAPVSNYTTLYGWVESAGPVNANERWRGQQRLRAIGVLVGAAGGAGVLFYLWLGCTFLRDPQAIAAVKDPRTTWLGKKKRHG